MIQKGETQQDDGPLVIGAGLPRTGTMSLKTALEMLGYDPCHHFINGIIGESFPNPGAQLWTKAANAEDKETRQQYIRQAYKCFPCKAAVDYPTSLFVEDLVEMYPNAKFVHGVRSSKEAWRKSFNDTIGVANSPLYSVVCLLVPGRLVGMQPLLSAFQRRNIKKHDALMYSTSDDTELYDKHNEWVRRVVPEERRIEFDPRMGWGPLCEHLDVPIPTDENGNEIPYPHVNDTKTIQKGLRVFLFVGLGWWAAALTTSYLSVKYLIAPLWKRHV